MNDKTDEVCEVCEAVLTHDERRWGNGWCQECSGRDRDEDFIE